MVESNTADAIVVGGGVVGTSITHYLAEKGLTNVTLLEKDYLASGASGYAVALVRMHYLNPWETALAVKSWEVFKNWEEIIGGNCGFRKTGYLMLVGPENVGQLHKNVGMQREIGAITEVVSAEDIKIMQPFMYTEDVGAAAYEPESGFGDGTDTANSFVRRARELGATVKTEVRATSFSRTAKKSAAWRPTPVPITRR